MKYLIGLILMVSATAFAVEYEAGEYETVFVPEGKEVRIVPKGSPENCLTVEVIKMEAPGEPDEVRECNDSGLTLGPGDECSGS